VTASSAILKNREEKEVLFIAGGYNKETYLKLTETYNGSHWDRSSTESLPKPIFYSCFAKINESTILVIGGRNSKFEVLENSFFYNIKTNKWTEGPSLNVGRGELSCGVLRWKDPKFGKFVQIVVAAGGRDKDFSPFSSVELLHLNDDSTNNGGWIMGPELPKKVTGSTMVEFNNSVILIGGWGGVNSHQLYRLSSPNGTWTEMKQVTQNRRFNHVSFLVPDEIVNCKVKNVIKIDLN